MRKSISGFTVVELLIVIVVIAILASVSVVAYSGIQNRATDTALRAGMDQLEKALKLYVQEYGSPPKGGYGSNVAVVNGRCADGADGFVGSGSYTCTIEDALVSAGYLKRDSIRNLPANTYFGDSSNGGRSSVMFYASGCSATQGGYILLTTLRNPTDQDTANMDWLIGQSCVSAQLRDGWGMRAARVVKF